MKSQKTATALLACTAVAATVLTAALTDEMQGVTDDQRDLQRKLRDADKTIDKLRRDLRRSTALITELASVEDPPDGGDVRSGSNDGA